MRRSGRRSERWAWRPCKGQSSAVFVASGHINDRLPEPDVERVIRDRHLVEDQIGISAIDANNGDVHPRKTLLPNHLAGDPHSSMVIGHSSYRGPVTSRIMSRQASALPGRRGATIKNSVESAKIFPLIACRTYYWTRYPAKLVENALESV